MRLKPLHIHDCKDCQFLFTLDKKDYYHCFHSICEDGTIVIRYGNEGWEYSSYPCEIVCTLPEIIPEEIINKIINKLLSEEKS